MQNSQFSLPANALSRALLVVAKRPEPGQTKTRLAPPLTSDQAASLYACFLYDTLEIARQVPQVHRMLAFLPASAQQYFRLLAPDFETVLQAGDGLGARLEYCLTTVLKRGYRSAVIMSSDTPNLPAGHILAAFTALENGADVALGPCEDGGYYLIGLKHPAPRLLLEVRMSTPSVTADTLSLAREEDLQVELLPVWYDVDDVAGLNRLADDLERASFEISQKTRALLHEFSPMLRQIA
jgi:rSAM/selenodomain-associated transferase 1